MASPAYGAFQGGGALGMAHLGAWQIIARRFDFRGVAGTSAGAIVAALCAAGYTPRHAIDLFENLDWTAFVNRQGMLDLIRKRDAWSDGELFYQWLLERLAAYLPGTSAHNMTFAKLHQETDIYLAVFACDLNNPAATPILFDKDTEPNEIVAFAVRASISIPGVFSTIQRRGRGQELIDGGLLLNFPVEHLQSRAKREACPLIGIRFNRPLAHLETPKIWEVLKRSYELVLTPGSHPPPKVAQDSNYIDVVIDITGFNSLNFNLTISEKQELLRRGADAAEKALLQYDRQIAQAAVLTASQSTTVAADSTPTSISQMHEPDMNRVPPTSKVTSSYIPPYSSEPNAETDSATQTSSPSHSPHAHSSTPLSDRLANISKPQVLNLTNRLLDCPSIRNHSTRNTVLSILPAHILDSIDRNSQGRADMLNVVTTCLNFAGGIEALINAVRYFDGESIPMRNLDMFLDTL